MSDADLERRVRERLSPLPVTSRKMFGSIGLYLEERYFGVITDGKVYFRTDGESREAYLDRDMPALQPEDRPRGPKTVDRNFEVPREVLADPAMLKDWALRAAAAKR